eukprot:6829546-Ditylum_brightwellii.AAC.1
MHDSFPTDLLLQIGQYFNILEDFLYLRVASYSVGIKPTMACLSNNPIDIDEESMTSVVKKGSCLDPTGRSLGKKIILQSDR